MKKLVIGISIALLLFASLVAQAYSQGAQPDTTINWQTCPEQTPKDNSQSTGATLSKMLNEWKNSIQRKLNEKKYLNDLERTELVEKLKQIHEHSKRLELMPDTVPQFDQQDVQQGQQDLLNIRSTAKTAVAVVECALIGVPLVYNSSSDTTKIEYFVKRWRVPGRTPKGQLWLLQGGPGAPGTVFDGVSRAFQQYLNEDYDVYAPDFRGTGRSTFLSCSNGVSLESTDSSKVQRCAAQIKAQYGSNGLYGFGTTQAANDVITVRRLAKQSDNELLAVYGVSYGTYLLNRILQLYPNEVDTTIFDSVVQVDMSFTDRDDQFNEAGDRYIEVCKASSSCNGRFQREFGQDVDTVLLQVFKKQAGSDACHGTVFTPDAITQFNAIVLANKDLRRIVFPIIFRLNRCGSQDQQWLTNVGRVFTQLQSSSTQSIDGPASDSGDIFINVVSGELTTYPITTTAQEWINKYSIQPPYFWANFSPSFTQTALAMESVRYTDPLSHTYANQHTKPVLTMQGTLDPQTPYSFVEAWNQHYNRDNNYFVSFPNAVHATAFSTPTSSQTQFINNYCGSVVMLEFIKNNNGVTTSCVSQTEDATFNFNVLPQSVAAMTGGLPLWDDSGTRPTVSPSGSSNAVRASMPVVAVLMSVILLLL